MNRMKFCLTVSLLVTLVAHGATSSFSIVETSPPLPHNIVARGFTGLTLKALFPNNDSECRWNLKNLYSTVIFKQNQTCTNNSDRGLTCIVRVIEGISYISTTLTISRPILSNLSVSIGCTRRFVTLDLDIQVQDCEANYPPLNVASNSTTYNSRGAFYCEDGSTLVNRRDDTIAPNDTVCLRNAEWEGFDQLDCWNAPSVRLNGDLSMLEGDSVSVTCDYDDVYPQGNQSEFIFNDVQIVLEKGQQFTIPKIKRTDNGKPIFCKALTPFTEKYSSVGRSTLRHINVTYAPYQPIPTKCIWFSNETQLCNVSFSATTSIKLDAVRKNGLPVDGVISQISILSNDVVAFYYAKQNVDFADAGIYQVDVSFPIPPYNRILGFDIEVTERSSLTTPVVSTLWIALICLAVYGLFLTMVAFCLCSKTKSIRRKRQGEAHYEQPMHKSDYTHAKDIDSPEDKVNPFSSSPKRGSESHNIFSSTIHESSSRSGLCMENFKTEYAVIADPPLNAPTTSPRNPLPGYEVMSPRSPRPSKEKIVSHFNDRDTYMTKI